MGNGKERALSSWERFAYSVGNFGVGSLPAVIGSWALYYFSPPEAAAGETSCMIAFVPYATIMALALALGRVAEALVNPFIGDWSDKTKNKLGRRIPFIRYGTPIMAIAAVILWFPPIIGPSWINAVWVGFFMIIMSVAFAAVVAPYLSLLPELTPHNDERIVVSSWMAVAELAGVLAVTAGAGAIITQGKCGMFGFEPQQFNGFHAAAIIFAVVGAISFLVTGYGIKERPYSESKNVSFSFKEGSREIFKNPSFLPYLSMVALMRIALDIVIVAIPYIATTILGGDEWDASKIMIIVTVGAMALFPLVTMLSTRFGKKNIMILGAAGFVIILPLAWTLGHWPVFEPMTQGYILFLFATFPVSAFMVLPRPMLADVIDHDEKLTGFRREAIYNGMEGLFTRSASGLAWVLSAMLFDIFGKSVDNPLGIYLTGPLGGAVALLALIGFLKYPFKK